MSKKSIGKPLQYKVSNQNPRKQKDLWRYELSVGDLVEMKSGHLAIITKVRGDDYDFYGTDAIPPKIEIMFCDDSSKGSCSSWRVRGVVK